MKKTIVSEYQLLEILGLRANALKEIIINKHISQVYADQYCAYYDLLDFKYDPFVDYLLSVNFDEFINYKSEKKYKSIELFAGCGGLALGLEKAGFENILLNEFDVNACRTLRANRPGWNVVEGDITNISFEQFIDIDIDLVAGGFPCQAFSYAGNSMGFEDTRGTLFFEYARVVKEVKPKLFLAENVKGLLTHDGGKTLQTIKNTLEAIGYTLLECDLYKAIFFNVPQKRERVILVGVRNDLAKNLSFEKPCMSYNIPAVEDALWGVMYGGKSDELEGMRYSSTKSAVFELVPEGGYWVDLPENVQRDYMGGSYFAQGGKTGIARRLHSKKPSLTLTCSPAQKQTDRCHPFENRPLSIREYARIQTFPDEWSFEGSVSSRYKQIGNAVPVNLAYALGVSLIKLLDNINNCKNK